MPLALSNHTVLVTGGATPLGERVALALGADGARVAVHHEGGAGRARAQDTVSALRLAGGEAFALQADLTRAAHVRRVFADVLERFDGLFATVHAAGVALEHPVAEVSEAEFDRLMLVNAKAAFFVMQQAAGHLEAGGRIVSLLASPCGTEGCGDHAVCAGGTAAVERFARALAEELADWPISVNCLAAGPPEDVLAWVRFLLTDGSWASGETFSPAGLLVAS